jgi:hypothetical protein
VREYDDKALRVLAKLAGVEVCKPAVARAKGISVLTKLYTTATEDMSTFKTEAAVSSLVLLAIDALASLATDATCRTNFSEGDAKIQPLVHFIWSCSALSTKNYHYEEWVVLAHNDGEPQEGYGPVLTPFGRRRIAEKVWQSENAASEALCALLGDVHCRDAVMKLGTFIDMKSGKLGRVPHTRDGALTPRNCFPGWVALANQVVKGMKDIEKAKPWDGTETDRGIPAVGSYRVWPSERVALGPGLLRAVWNLVDDNGTKSGVQAIKNFMTNASRASVLNFFLLCGQFEVLDYDKLLDSLIVIKSTQAIRWATEYDNLKTDDRAEDIAEFFWAACVLMNALTLERPSGRRSRKCLISLAAEMNYDLLEQKNLNGDEDDRKLFVPLVERWVFKTRRSDMDKKCIPFLVKGAELFTSPADSSEDEDDDRSSEGDSSGDDLSDSDNDDGSDTSGSSQGSANAIVRDPRRECLVRLAKLWSDHEDTIRGECSVSVVQEVQTLLPADATIEIRSE